ncbi:MAG: TrpB-like pyridoxal phosphate-dependent enzyme [Candidatus Omnitrophica bacterium]|nr:TrpB-like pyridoxal phosphate-dependent enzyme [Candidatus Omnitrophota bacterium]
MSDVMIMLNKNELPRAWYNIHADLTQPLPPPLHPGTGKPATPEDFAAIFPAPLIEQEVSRQQWIPIPEPVLDIYTMWRPTPLIRARRLEQFLQTPAKIYYKDESVSPAGSHKVNTAVAQAYYNKISGTKRLATETGAGQWGSALSFATQLFGLECVVYMVKVSYEQKPYRRSLMQIWNATIHASPSPQTEVGRKFLEADPQCPGSLGIAISEAIADTVSHAHTKYALGSVLNHVMLHQTVIGLETREQLQRAGDSPDVFVGCVGGGSNFAGLAFPFIFDRNRKKSARFIAVEPSACPTLTKGPYCYDFGDTAQMTPLLKMFTLGHGFVPPGIHAGGLRYHGMAPLVSALYADKLIEAVSYPQTAVFEAAVTFARTEGRIPAPETAHAVRAAIDEAVQCRNRKEAKTIVFNFSGHGFFDLVSYDKYLAGKLDDFSYSEEKINEALRSLPKVNEPA